MRALGARLFILTRSTTEVAPLVLLDRRVRLMLRIKNRVARTQVVRVSKSPAPRALIIPDGPPPMPRAPPSDRCRRTTAISEMLTRI